MQAIETAHLNPTAKQDRRIRESVADAIQRGQVGPAQKKAWMTQAREGQKLANRSSLMWHVERLATSVKKIPGEPEVLEDLLSAGTPERIREICEDAHIVTTIETAPGVFREVQMPNWPLPYGSLLPVYLSEHADAFIAAKSDSRYPKSERTSSRLKQLWFLSRALAGASFNISTRTAINLVGSTRPEEVFEGSRAARPRRKRRKSKT